MMNDLLKNLAEQAGLTWKAQPRHFTNTNNPVDFPRSANADLEKFAELIIRECASEAFNFWCDQFDPTEGSAEGHILRHFGIK